MTEPVGPLTTVATDLTKVIEDVISAATGLSNVGGMTVESLLDDAADHVVQTLPVNAPLVGGVMGLVAQLSVAVLKTGGLAGHELSAASQKINDYVQGQPA